MKLVITAMPRQLMIREIEVEVPPKVAVLIEEHWRARNETQISIDLAREINDELNKLIDPSLEVLDYSLETNDLKDRELAVDIELEQELNGMADK